MRERLLESLVAGFFDDPLYQWLYPDPDLRPRALRANVSLILEHASDVGHVEAAPDLAGAAIWTDPGVALLEDPAPFINLLERWAPTRIETALACMEACAAHQPPHAGTLHMVAVHPDCRDRGLGSLLIHPWLEELHLAGADGYLESSNPRNLTFYSRAGFRILGEVPITADGPIMRPMVYAQDRSAPPAAGTENSRP